MDKLINTHIDKIDDIEEQLKRIIDEEMAQIDISLLMENPRDVLTYVVENIKSVFLDQYAEKAVELGFDLAKQIEQRIKADKTIKIDDSENPKLNDTGDSKK